MRNLYLIPDMETEFISGHKGYAATGGPSFDSEHHTEVLNHETPDDL